MQRLPARAFLTVYLMRGGTLDELIELSRLLCPTGGGCPLSSTGRMPLAQSVLAAAEKIHSTYLLPHGFVVDFTGRRVIKHGNYGENAIRAHPVAWYLWCAV